MKNLLQSLSETLDKMILTYKDIFVAAQSKQEHIISGDIDKLESVIYQERNLSETILLLEEKRRYILETIYKELGYDCDSTKLSDLIEQLKEPYKSRVKKQYDILVEIITKVEGVNKSNTTLTKYSLEYINNLVKSICTESLNDNTYQKSGKFSKPELHRLMFEVSA